MIEAARHEVRPAGASLVDGAAPRRIGRSGSGLNCGWHAACDP